MSEDVDITKITYGVLLPHDWEILCDTARIAATLPEPVFVEVGTRRAYTSAGIMRLLDLAGLPAVRYVGIDPDKAANRRWFANLYIRRTRHRADFLYMPSVDAAPLVPDGSVAWCFLDGCHCEECTTADIRVWAPKIAPGGFMACHDSNPAVAGLPIGKYFPHAQRGFGVYAAIDATHAEREAHGLALYGIAKPREGEQYKVETWTTVFRRTVA